MRNSSRLRGPCDSIYSGQDFQLINYMQKFTKGDRKRVGRKSILLGVSSLTQFYAYTPTENLSALTLRGLIL